MKIVRRDAEPADAGRFARIHDIVRCVPAGRVVSYGMVAAMAGRCTPRMVGFAMASLPHGSDVPWHRVINSQGRISLRDGAELQRRMLEAEGVVFDDRGRVDLKRFGWKGPGARGSRRSGSGARGSGRSSSGARRPDRSGSGARRPTRTPSARGR